MSKHIIKSNVHLEIEYGGYYHRRNKPLFERQVKDYRALLKDIRFHCRDKLHGRVTWDTDAVCEFCGCRWETAPNGRPLCCAKAVEEWNREVDRQEDPNAQRNNE